jgi:hypothetical protein
MTEPCRYGSGMPRSLQIFLARSSLISVCLGNAGCSAGGADEDGVIATFPEQAAAVLLQVVNERASLHALILSGSRMTGPSPVVC